MRFPAERLKSLFGSKSALSTPVLIGLAITGFLLSFTYLQLIPGQPRVVTVGASAVAAGVSVAVLLIARSLGNRDNWVRPHPAIVLGGMALASLARSMATSVFVNGRTGEQELGSNTFARTIATLIITMAIGVIMAASATLARERAEVNSALLAEQSRLRRLAANADDELIRADVELREKARILLEPTIEGIRELISGEISEKAALRVSERINAAVNDVVRPVSHELACSPLFAREESMSDGSTPLRLLKGRMDITQAIRPWWWFALSWGALIPGPLILGAQISIIAQWIAISLITVPLLLVVKAVWPRRYRNMLIPLGLGMLLILYSLTNLGIYFLASHAVPVIAGSETWATNSLTGSIIRISLGMLVSIVATLDVHGRQLRANLIDTNSELEKLIARIKRETWQLHRSVSLAVHGTVQSALISTAMRLSAIDRTPETVADARLRLEHALTAISADQGEGVSLGLAIADLQGLWNPIVIITFEISPLAEQLLSQDIGLRRCTIEICREAVSNAIRHGHAKTVDFEVKLTGGLINLRATDDGEGVSSVALPGLGSEMLDDTCMRWQLSALPQGGSELIAVLA